MYASSGSDNIFHHGSFIYSLNCNGKLSYLLGTIHIEVAPTDLEPWITSLHDQTRFHAYEHYQTYENPVKYNERKVMFADFLKTGRVGKANNENVAPCSQVLDKTELQILANIGFELKTCPKDIKEKFLEFIPTLYLIQTKSITQLDLELHTTSTALNKTVTYLEDDHIRQVARQKELKEFGDDSFIMPSSYWLKNDGEKLKNYLDSFKQSIEQYKKGQISIEDYFHGSDSDDMIYRNKHWLPTIKNLCVQGDAFISVGQLHLFGRNGLVSLLLNEGVRVKLMTEKDYKSLTPNNRPYR